MTRALFLAVALAVGLAPASAHAAEAFVNTDAVGSLHIVFRSAPGEANDVNMQQNFSGWTIYEAALPITPGTGCRQGGGFNVVICAESAPNRVFDVRALLGDGDDRLQFGSLSAELPGDLLGEEGNDVLTGGAGPDTLDGGPGNDTITGGGEADQISGGDGDDTIDSRDTDVDDGEAVSCGAGLDTVSADTTDPVAADCEMVQTTVPPDTDGDGVPDTTDACPADRGVAPTGCPEADGGGGGGDDGGGDDGDGESPPVGGSGNDTIRGTKRADTLRGFAGNDKLFGLAGNDKLFGGKGDDRITGGKGKDQLVGNAGDDRFFARDGKKDTIRCGPGEDRVSADKRDVVSGCEAVTRR